MLPIDHIGIAVDSGMEMEHLIKKLAHSTSALPEDVDEQGVRVRFYGSGTCLEVLEPLNANSAVARFLSKHGEGLHHIAFRVANAELQLARMRAIGFQPLTEVPISGANGKHIFFLHPKQTCRILVEFCQPRKQYRVRFNACPELERIMQLTGHCIPPDTSPDHIVTGGPVPQRCQSLVLHNISSRLSQHKFDLPSVPVLISETSDASHNVYALLAKFPEAQVAILPESSQPKCLPEVLLNFWESLKNE